MSLDIDVNERINKDFESLVRPWKLPDPKKYAFVNGSIVDSDKGQLIENMTVLTSGGIFEDIVHGSALPEGYTVVDCTGQFLCPGLFDNHVHVFSSPGETDIKRQFSLPKNIALVRATKNIEMMLARGFTSVRDTGGADDCLAQAVEEGVINGPRLFFCGPAISQTGGHGDFRDHDMPGKAYDSCSCHMAGISVVADGVTECIRTTRENLRRGAHFIKIMGGGGVASPTDRLTNLQYSEEEIRAIVDVAESFDTFVTAHAYTTRSIKHCVNNGVKGIEHGNLLDDEVAKLMAKKGVYLTPTLITYKVMSSDQFGSYLTPSAKEKNTMVLKTGLQSLMIAKRNKVKICYGSDLLGSLTGYQTGEFFLRGKVLTAAEILKSATITPAECLGVSDKIGQIKRGFLADMLILKANPLKDIGVLDEPEDNLRVVMKDGIIFKSTWDELPTEITHPL